MGPASKHPSNSWNAPGVAAHLRNVAERDDVFMLLEGKILSTKVRGNFRRPSSLTPPPTRRVRLLSLSRTEGSDGGASVWSCVGQPPPPPP